MKVHRLQLPAGLVADQREKTAVLVLSAAAAIVYTLSLAPHSSGVDDTIYVLMGTAIQRGQFLRAIHVVGAPAMQYQVGLPALLAPLIAAFPAFPNNLPVLQLVPLLSAVASIPVAAGVLRRMFPELAWPLRLAIVAFTTFNFAGTWYATQVVMTEMVYLLLSLLALLLLADITSGSRRSLLVAVAIGVLMAASYYVRTAAVSLVIAGILHLVLRRRWREAGVVFAVFLTCYLPMLAYERMQQDSLALDFYGQQFLLRDFWHPELGVIESPLELGGRLLRNVAGHAKDSLPLLFAPTLSGGAVQARLASAGLAMLPPVVGALILVLIAVGWIRRVVGTRLGLAELYLLAYAGVILAPPWVTYRNLVPVLLFLAAYFCIGGMFVAHRVSVGLRHPATGERLVAAFLGVALISNLISFRHNLADGARFRAAGLTFRPPATSLTEAAGWITVNTPVDATVFFRAPEEMYLRSGRRTVEALSSNLPRPFSTRSTADLLAIVESQIDFVVLVEEADDWLGNLGEAVVARPEQFRPVYRTLASPAIVVYANAARVTPMGASSAVGVVDK